jgi:hypothetical protein
MLAMRCTAVGVAPRADTRLLTVDHTLLQAYLSVVGGDWAGGGGSQDGVEDGPADGDLHAGPLDLSVNTTTASSSAAQHSLQGKVRWCVCGRRR